MNLMNDIEIELLGEKASGFTPLTLYVSGDFAQRKIHSAAGEVVLRIEAPKPLPLHIHKMRMSVCKAQT